MTARVLVVDDVPANVKLLEARLSAEYFDDATAMCGADALAICAKAECDIVLLDVMMPEMDGIRALEELRKIDPHVAVIMLTGYGTVDEAIRAMKEGAHDFLNKESYRLSEFEAILQKEPRHGEDAVVALITSSIGEGRIEAAQARIEGLPFVRPDIVRLCVEHL